VPVAVAILHGAPGSGAALAMGAGAGASIGDAWLKALGEAFGVFRWLRSQDEPPPSDPGAVETFADHMRFYADDMHAAQAAFLDASAERTATADVRPLEGTTGAEQLAAVVGRLDDRGLKGYAVDVTSPDVRSLGLAVVRVIVPELCPLDVSHRARFLGGRRLTHAAYEAELLAAPLRVSDLNPLPHPFP
jgi:ribosomal protein S12 methylthiotransferase accessory factor